MLFICKNRKRRAFFTLKFYGIRKFLKLSLDFSNLFSMKTLGIIPARYDSSRFPGKPLAEIDGMTMLERVYRQVEKSRRISSLIVATDDDRIFRHVKNFGGDAMMTSATHQSGTDRCAEVAAMVEGFDCIVNIQGDEPFIDPEQIDAVIIPLAENEEAGISTLAKLISKQEEIFNPSIVKVVVDALQKAMYFSRSPIPHLRGTPPEQWLEKGRFFKHIGLYGFRRSILLQLAALKQGYYEQAEALEQLRWLEAGYEIWVGLTERETIGIDTPEDLEKAVRFLKEQGG
jgi:3-deoxy-manno-octulosonate cytidylyltransferase (CMP-KDO synthetase)